MAVAIQPIPGLHVPPTIEDLKRSSLAYNRLPCDDDQPQVQQTHLRELADLFNRFNVQDKFGMHLIHGHFRLDEGNVMLGTALQTVRGYWTKPTSITDIKPEEIHGHIFRLAPDGGMQAYEYRHGPIINTDDDHSEFFGELARYLNVNHLMDVLGLEILTEKVPEMVCEFILKDEGTVMLDEKHVKGWMPHRVTGFAVSPGMTELKGGQAHAKTVKGTHQVFIDGKIGGEDSLIEVLRSEGIIP